MNFDNVDVFEDFFGSFESGDLWLVSGDVDEWGVCCGIYVVELF